MGSVADFLKNNPTGHAVSEAPRAPVDPSEDFGWLGGFMQSAISSFPEFIWQDPTPEAERFREDNPITGFVSQMAPYVLGYGGALRAATRLPALAGGIEGTLGRVGLSQAETPIRYWAGRGVLTDALVDYPRAAIGYATAPEHNQDDILGDTLINQAFSLGIGGAFGYLTKSGGAGLDRLGLLEQGHPDWNNVRTFREARALGDKAVFRGGLSNEENMADLMQSNLFPPRGERVPTFRPGADWTDDATALLRDLAATGSEETSKVGGRNTRWLVEGSETNLSNLNPGEQADVLRRAGFETIEDLNETVITPREVRFHNADAAKTMTDRLHSTPGMNYMGDGVWAAVEDGGIVSFIKKIDESLTAKGKPRARKEGAVRNGDAYLYGQTDQFEKIMPQLAAEQRPVVQAWAMMGDSMRNTHGGAYNQVENMTYGKMLEGTGPGDFRSAGIRAGAKKERVIAGMAARYSSAMEGLTGGYSHNARQAAERLYDVMAVSASKNTRNVLRRIPFNAFVQRADMAKGAARQAVRGKQVLTKGGGKLVLGAAKRGEGLFNTKSFAQIYEDLTEGELLALDILEMSRSTPDNIADSVPAELITPRLRKAYEESIAVDKAIQGPYFVDPLVGTDEGGAIKMADNYTGSGQARGQWYVNVADENGHVVAQVSDDNRALAIERAKTYVDTAMDDGVRWKAAPVESFLQSGGDDVSRAAQQIAERLTSAQGPVINSIINKAVKRWAYQRFGPTLTSYKPRRPGDLTPSPGGNTRMRDPTRKAPTKEEMLQRKEKHYSDIFQYAAFIDGNRRYKSLMSKLEKFDPVASEDLQHQINNIFGVKGPTARYLDSKLRNVFGDALGGNAASKIAGASGSFLYRMQLGIMNTTAAVMNLMSTVQLLVPHLAYIRSAPVGEVAAMMDMVPEMLGGKVTGILGHMSMAKVMGRAIRNLGSDAPQELKQLLGTLDDKGILGSSAHTEFTGGNSPIARTINGAFKDAGGGIAGGIRAIDEIATFMARTSEDLPRIITVNAAYDIGKNMLHLDGDILEHFVTKMLRRAMYGHATQDRAKIFTGPIGATFGLFKNFAFHYINDFATYAKLAKNENVWSPLVWQIATTGAVGGIGATPLKYLADGYANWMEEYPDGATWLSESFGENGDALYYGLPSFMNVTLQSSAAMPGTDIVQDVSNLTNAVAISKGMEIGKALYAAGAYAVGSGENPLRNPNVRDQLMAATMPRAYNRVASVIEGDYVKSMRTGYPSVRDVSVSQRVIQGLGFNDLEIARRAHVGRQLWKQKAETQMAISALGQRLSQAQLNYDTDEMTAVTADALEMGVDLGSVYNSARTRYMRETRQDALSLYGAENVMEYGIEP